MGYRLKEIAELVEGRLIGDGQRIIEGINRLNQAGASELSFFKDKRYEKELKETRASALLLEAPRPELKVDQIIVKDAFQAYLKVAKLFRPDVPLYEGPLHHSFVHPDAKVRPGVSIYPYVYVGKGALVEEGAILFPGVYVGDYAEIGKNTVLYPNVVIMPQCKVGANCIFHPGVVVGADGFGYYRDELGIQKVPQIGRVVIGDGVELGANTCIDRAALGSTLVGNNVKMDNLVQVGHNVEIGDNTLVVAQAGISGSVRIGRGVIIGGQVGISDHVVIGDGAMIGSQSGVAKDIPPGEVVSGTPTMPHRLWLRVVTLLKDLPLLFERVRRIERRLGGEN